MCSTGQSDVVLQDFFSAALASKGSRTFGNSGGVRLHGLASLPRHNAAPAWFERLKPASSVAGAPVGWQRQPILA